MTPALHDSEGPPTVGYFTYSVVDDHWSWSEGMYAAAWFRAGEVTPSTGLLLEHQHGDDRAGVYEVLDTAVQVRHRSAATTASSTAVDTSTLSSWWVVASATTAESLRSWRASSSTSRRAPLGGGGGGGGGKKKKKNE